MNMNQSNKGILLGSLIIATAFFITRGRAASNSNLDSVLNVSKINIVNRSGKCVISLGSDASGEPLIHLNNLSGQASLMFALGPHQNPGIIMRGIKPVPTILLGIDKSGKPSELVMDQDGTIHNLINGKTTSISKMER